MCRTNLVSPEQSDLSIPTWSTETTVLIPDFVCSGRQDCKEVPPTTTACYSLWVMSLADQAVKWWSTSIDLQDSADRVRCCPMLFHSPSDCRCVKPLVQVCAQHTEQTLASCYVNKIFQEVVECVTACCQVFASDAVLSWVCWSAIKLFFSMLSWSAVTVKDNRLSKPLLTFTRWAIYVQQTKQIAQSAYAHVWSECLISCTAPVSSSHSCLISCYTTTLIQLASPVLSCCDCCVSHHALLHALCQC